MVWALLPVDDVPGEDEYYIYLKGRYKVGRKGCDIIINKAKGVSRVHAEIVIDAMFSLDGLTNEGANRSSHVKILDCSKYGTFIKRNHGLREKVHEFPHKEANLSDGDLIQFGTGNATYRFCYISLVFFPYNSEPFQVSDNLNQKAALIGAHITSSSRESTHVIVEQFLPVTEAFLDVVLAKKPFVLKDWIEHLAEVMIRNELLSYSPYIPTITLEGVHVKIAVPETRENCLKGYAFLMEFVHKYRFGQRLHLMLETWGSKPVQLEDFRLTGQLAAATEKSARVVYIIPATSSEKSSHGLGGVSMIKEIDLVCAVLGGHLDPCVLEVPSVVVSSSCSTDETVVADSDTEVDTETTVQVIPPSNVKHDDHNVVEAKRLNQNATKYISSKYSTDGLTAIDKMEGSQSENSHIIYSQELIVRDNTSTVPPSIESNGVPNFKCFRKTSNESGNSFNNLIPFSKNPYRESDCGGEQTSAYMKEEKKRQKMEALAEDLFNNDRGIRQGSAGTLRRFLKH